jgi:hypothetical protein
MSEESTTPDLVELVDGAFEAVNRRDLDALMEEETGLTSFGKGCPPRAVVTSLRLLIHSARDSEMR